MKIIVKMGDVLTGWQDTQGIAEAETNRAYAEEFEDRLQKAYPNAEIEVQMQPNIQGLHDVTVLDVPYDDERGIRDGIHLIEVDLINHPKTWVVDAKAND